MTLTTFQKLLSELLAQYNQEAEKLRGWMRYFKRHPSSLMVVFTSILQLGLILWILWLGCIELFKLM